MHFKVSESTVFDKSLKTIHNKNNRQNKVKLSKNEYEQTTLKWCLSKYIKKREPHPDECDFFPTSSSDILKNGLDSNQVLNFINSNSIIENYQPQNNDFLKIWLEYKHSELHKKSRPYISNYLSFLFDEKINKWRINNGFDSIDYLYEDISEGEAFI